MSAAVAFLQTPSCVIMPQQTQSARHGELAMAKQEGERSWLSKLSRPALRAHARRFAFLVGLDGLREIADALPKRAQGRPAEDRSQDLRQALEVYFTTPGLAFESVVKQLVRDGTIVPLRHTGETPEDGTAKDLSRRRRELRKKAPEFENALAEEIAARGLIIREDEFPEIYQRQLSEMMRSTVPSVLRGTAAFAETARAMKDLTIRLQHFRAAFSDLLPDRPTIRELSDAYFAARSIIHSEVETRKE